MSLRIDALTIDAADADRLGRFWAAALGWTVEIDDDEDTLVIPPEGTGVQLLPLNVPEAKVAQNSMHFDLSTTSVEDQQTFVEHLLSLGATPVDVGQAPDDKHVVLADPEGNELCVLEPGNRFVDYDTRLGSLSCDGSREAGVFWSEALGCPLVWDQDGETAIRVGGDHGLFITWGGTAPTYPGKNRLHLDVAPPADGSQQDEVERLIALGATHLDIGQGDVRWVVMADPDGNAFCVLTPR